MSRGEIVSSEGAGLYRVRLKYAVERVKAELERVNKRIAELAVLIPEKKLEVLQAEEKADDLRRDIDLLIDDYRQAPDEYAGQIGDLQVELAKQTAAIGRLRYQRDVLIAENLSLLKRRNLLEAVPESKTLDAWCADFTEELSGEVGLADLNDEGGRGVIIQPGFSGEAGYDASRDGSLFPDIAQSAPQLYFNLAILPGVQKWRPGYRLGTISDLNGDACTVTLDDAFSSAQQLNINQQAVYQSVPIQYMDCNGSAFEDGDRVLVRFTDSGPLVIGFEKEPVPCSDISFVFWVSRYQVVMPDKVSFAIVHGQPYEAELGEINPPIGAEDGYDGVWKLNYKAGSYNIEKGLPQRYGYRNWIGDKGVVLSWAGPPTRMYDVHGLGEPDTKDYPNQPGDFAHWRKDWMAGPEVFMRGEVLWVFSDNVHGAAVYTEGDQRYLVAVVNSEKYLAESGAVVRVALDEQLRPIPEAQEEELFTFYNSTQLASTTDWYFSHDGKEAVCTARNRGNLLPEQIYRMRLNVGTGVSYLKMWDKADIIGTTTLDYTNILSDDIVPEVIERRVITSRSISENKRPIYYEYIGDEVVEVSQKLPAYSLYRDNHLTGRLNTNFPRLSEGTSSFSETVTSEGPTQIVTSEGKVLAEAPFTWSANSDSTTQLQFSDDGQATPSGTLSESINEAFSSTDNELKVVSIDARFNFCAVWCHYFTSDYTTSADDPYDTQDGFNEWVVSFSGSNSDSEEVNIFMDGVKQKTLQVQGDSFSGNSTYTQTAALSIPQGFGVDSFTSTNSLGDTVNTEYGARGLLWGAGVKANGQKALSLVYYEPELANDRSPVWYSQMDGYPDVISNLLEQDSAEGFVLDRLSIQ